MTQLETSWPQLYRPQSFEEMILPAHIRKFFIKIRDNNLNLPLLFTGPPGTGKTSASKLFNASDVQEYAGGIDMNLMKILPTALSSFTLYETRRVVIINEADNLKKSDRDGFKTIIEDYSANNIFIFTSNKPASLGDALLSRLNIVDFAFDKGNIELRAQLKQRILQILDKENFQPNERLIKRLLDQHFPDMRSILKSLQVEYI